MQRSTGALGVVVAAALAVIACSGTEGGEGRAGATQEPSDAAPDVAPGGASAGGASAGGAGREDAAAGRSGAGGRPVVDAAMAGSGALAGSRDSGAVPPEAAHVDAADGALPGLDGCPSGEKRCRGYCFPATPENGCLLLGCEPCSEPTGANEVAVCDGPVCGAACADGYHRGDAGDCVQIRGGCRIGPACDPTEKPCGDVCCLRITEFGCSLDATCAPCPMPTTLVGTTACVNGGFCGFACPDGYRTTDDGCEPLP